MMLSDPGWLLDMAVEAVVELLRDQDSTGCGAVVRLVD